MGVKIKFHLVDSDIEIIRKINLAGIKKFKTSFYDKSKINAIENIVQKFVITAIENSYTWRALSRGGLEGLDAHFGIPRGELQGRLSRLLNIWASQIHVRVNDVVLQQRRFILSYVFYAIEADWEKILSSPDGVTINDSANSRLGITPKEIPWMEWLLVAGDGSNIEGYHIDFGNKPKSRSGKAFMKPNFSWSIPEGFAPFFTDNNFVTRELDKLVKDESFRQQILNELEGKIDSLVLEAQELSDIIAGIRR